MGLGGLNIPPGVNIPSLTSPGIDLGNIQNFAVPQIPNTFSMKPPGPHMGQIIPGSAAHVAAFHDKGPDNEIKLFVGGLAFQTAEPDLFTYFRNFGFVVDTIVMRERDTNKGRGFGFVKMRFENREKALDGKQKIIDKINISSEGHIINGKRVDVKSADDYTKPPPGSAPVR